MFRISLIVILLFATVTLANALSVPALFGANGNRTYSYNAETGELISNFIAGGSGMVYGSDDLLYTTAWGAVNAYDPENGSIINSFNTNFSTTSPLAFGQGLLFGNNGGRTYSYDVNTGELKNSFLAGGSGLVFGTDNLLYTSSWGVVDVYDPMTGVLQNSFTTNFSTYSPITYGQGLLFGTNGSTTYSYDVITGALVNSFIGGGSSIIYGENNILYTLNGIGTAANNASTGMLINMFDTNFSSTTQLAYGSCPDPVPEPSTFFLFGSGLTGFIFYRRKRR